MPNIVIIGKSGSGKTTISDILTENFRYNKAIQTTTRPVRDGEVDGVDYNFVQMEEFNEMIENNEFIEYNEYRGWKYGTEKDQLDKKENLLFVLNPHGLEEFAKNNIDFVSIYIKSKDVNRLIRQFRRGDDIKEIERRYYTDNTDFQGIEDNVDIVVDNDCEPFVCVDEILKGILEIEENKN